MSPMPPMGRAHRTRHEHGLSCPTSTMPGHYRPVQTASAGRLLFTGDSTRSVSDSARVTGHSEAIHLAAQPAVWKSAARTARNSSRLMEVLPSTPIRIRKGPQLRRSLITLPVRPRVACRCQRSDVTPGAGVRRGEARRTIRCLAATANNFAREAFTDELAEAAGKDPLEFRLAHLDNERIKNVLVAAAERFGWAQRRKKRRPGAGIGLACGAEKNSVVAACVEVEVDRESGVPRLHHDGPRTGAARGDSVPRRAADQRAIRGRDSHHRRRAGHRKRGIRRHREARALHAHPGNAGVMARKV